MEIQERIEESKCPLIMDLMHSEFEKKMAAFVSIPITQFPSNEQIKKFDETIDQKLRQYFLELKMICDYYKDTFIELKNEQEFIGQKQGLLIRLVGIETEKNATALLNSGSDIQSIDAELTRILGQYYAWKDSIIKYYDLPEEDEECDENEEDF